MYRRFVSPVLLTVALLLGSTGPARAVYPPPLKDDGKFFGKEAVDKANRKIRELYEKYRKDVIVETLATLTPEQEKMAREEDDRGRFFAKLTLDRSRELGLNGVYILIVKKPRYLRIHMDPETQKTTFSAASRTKTLTAITEKFKEGSFDAGLLAGLDAIEASFKGATAPTNKGTGTLKK
ncbi:MAG: TPM domain-containing protein [Gemmataceae bacterium]